MPLTKRTQPQTTNQMYHNDPAVNPNSAYADPAMNPHPATTAPGSGVGSAPYPDPTSTNTMGGGMSGAGTGAGMNSGAGSGMNDEYNTMTDPNIPPTDQIPPMHQTDQYGNPIHPRNQKTGSLKMEGKMEHVMGSLLCNTNMKEKGIMKEEQARAIKEQAMHLTEAERLETEALRRRERAVHHGADPTTRHLGGVAGSNNNGGMGMGTGAGNNFGTSNAGMQRNL